MTVAYDLCIDSTDLDLSPARANVAAITRAASLLGLSVAQVVSQGEATIISFRAGRNYADVECFDDGDAVAVTYNRNGEPRAWDVSLDEDGIRETLEKIRGHISQ